MAIELDNELPALQREDRESIREASSRLYQDWTHYKPELMNCPELPVRFLDDLGFLCRMWNQHGHRMDS